MTLSEWPNLLEDKLTCNPTTHMSTYRHIDASNNDDYTTFLLYNKEGALTYCTLVLAFTICRMVCGCTEGLSPGCFFSWFQDEYKLFHLTMVWLFLRGITL